MSAEPSHLPVGTPIREDLQPAAVGALLEAVHSSDVSGLQANLARGADLSVEVRDGFAPLHLAAQVANIAVVAELLAGRAPVNGRSHKGTGLTALHVAVARGAREIVACLLTWGADPDATDATGAGPLHLAALAGRVDLARDLLLAGADPDATWQDRTGEVLAEWARHHDVVALLRQVSRDQ